MASDFRKAAKDSIKQETRSQTDPDLDKAIIDGSETRVALQKADHSHIENMAKGDRGWIGSILGGPRSAPLSIGVIAMLFGGIAWGACLYMSQKEGADLAFWQSQSEKALGLSLTALGFVFGRTSS